jgi:hypothetical protein
MDTETQQEYMMAHQAMSSQNFVTPQYKHTHIDMIPVNPYQSEFIGEGPFHVSISDTNQVIVNYGKVGIKDISIIPTTNKSAISEYPCTNLNLDNETNLFSIGDNQAVYVELKEDANGLVLENTIKIIIAADGFKSKNYYPDTQNGGDYRYKLAVYKKLEGEEPFIEPHLMSSNIYHTSGLNADFIVYKCPDESSSGLYEEYSSSDEMLARLRFVGGQLAGIDEPVTDVALSNNVSEIRIKTCVEESGSASFGYSSGSSGGSDGSGGTGTEESSGSSKDTAIVPDQNGQYRKWYAMEASEVLFFDFQDIENNNGISKIEIDPTVVFCCEPNSLRAFASPDIGHCNATVKNNFLVIKSKFSSKRKKQKAHVMLKGVRRGFANVRLAYATFDDFVDNECRLNPRMTREQILKELKKHGVSK